MRRGLLAVVTAGALALPGNAFAAAITVDTNADALAADGHCSLREAISSANADAPPFSGAGECAPGSGSDDISLPAGLFKLTIAGAGEDANATGDLDITGGLTLKGAGASSTTVDGNHLDRVFDVAAGKNVSLSGLTITGGRTADGTNGSPASAGAGTGQDATG